jgi:putative lipoic acid-binding regulatory protein
MAANKPSGSFFNQIPDKDENDSASAGTNASSDVPADPFEESLTNMMKSRSEKKAKQPSTIRGVPTSGVGFSKMTTTTASVIKTTTSKKTFVGIGKPMNDVTKPEFDDQGYTLYADEETGEKSRVFEALVEYPSLFKLKIIGENESSFASEIVQVVADSCSVEFEEISYSERIKGKWLSLTVDAPVESAEMLYSLYENIDKDPRVKFKF